MGKTAGKQ